jgi:hypothetical protein
MKFPTIVLALSGVASAQFPFGGMGGGIGGGWGFAPSCAVCISFTLAFENFRTDKKLSNHVFLPHIPHGMRGVRGPDNAPAQQQ